MAVCSDFEGCLRASLEAAIPTEHHCTQVGRCMDDLNAVVKKRLDNNWRVCAFGSMANGFQTYHSDLDVVAYDTVAQCLDPVMVLKQLRSALEKTGLFVVKCVIYRARVPILKLVYEESLDVDLSVNNTMPLQNTRLLKAYTALSSRVGELGIVVKLWAQDQGLCGAGRGHLSSYGLLLMVIYFLQVDIPDRMPSLQNGGTLDYVFNDDDCASEQAAHASTRWCLSTSIGTLISDFFAFYVEEFRWGSEVVSVRLGLRTDASSHHFADLSGREVSRLHIEDPFQRTRNLNDVLWHEEELRQALRVSHASVCQERHLELLPQAPAPCVGDLVVSRCSLPASSSGYLGLELGDLIDVLHVGKEDDPAEVGWLYGQCTKSKHVRGCSGWLSVSKVAMAPRAPQLPDINPIDKDAQTLAHEPSMMVPVVSTEVVGDTTRVLVSVTAHGGGYLDLVAGEEVHIEYAGSADSADAGWLFGRTESGQGWFPTEAPEAMVPASTGGA